MTRKAHLTIDLEATLVEDFAAAVHCAQAKQADVLREMVEDYVERQKIDGAYRQFFEDKVSHARNELAAGKVVSAEDAERMFAERRQMARKAGGAA